MAKTKAKAKGKGGCSKAKAEAGQCNSSRVVGLLQVESNCSMSAAGCMCSVGGCQSSWPCTPSWLCHADATTAAAPQFGRLLRTSFLLFFAFNSSLVRNVFLAHPAKARARELKRILHFVDTAREARTRLPIHVAIAGERDASSEAQLLAAGVGLVRTPLVPPPRWASKWHRLSFSKIAALSLTQFDKVIVVDNDAALLRNMDELALAPAPAAVFHYTSGPLRARTLCAVTSGLLVLRPSAAEMRRAVLHLASLDYESARYDGGDEEFWHTFFPKLYELPAKYHAHRTLPLSTPEWNDVKMIHLITTFAMRGWHVPKNVTRRVEKYF